MSSQVPDVFRETDHTCEKETTQSLSTYQNIHVHGRKSRFTTNFVWHSLVIDESPNSAASEIHIDITKI